MAGKSLDGATALASAAAVLTPHLRATLLFAELRRWLDEGLLDARTFERLCKRVRACGLQTASEEACAALAVEDTSLDEELDAAASSLVARDLEEPSLEEELAREVAFVEEVAERHEQTRLMEREALAEALMAPVAERSSASLETLPAAAVEAAAETLEDARPTEVTLIERDVAQRAQGDMAETSAAESGGSFISRLLKPFLYQNALWVAGGLLILCGSLYFLRTIWDLSSTLWYVAVALLLHGYAAGFFAVGYLLCRREGAQLVGRILLAFPVALLPLGSVAAGEVVARAVAGGGAGYALALLAMALVLAGQGVMLWLIASIYERRSAAVAVAALLPLALTTALVAPLLKLAPSLLLGLPPLALFVVVAGLRALPRRRVVLPSTLLLVACALVWSLVVAVGRLLYSTAWPPTHVAPLLSTLAWALLDTDARLRARSGAPPRVSALRVGLYGALLAGPLLAIVGLVQAGYFDLAARVIVLLATVPATAGFARGAWSHGRRILTTFAAGCGLLTFFFLPAPFKGLLSWAQQALRGALGYEQAPLPVAYYGMAFLPYLLGLLLLARWLRQRRPDLSLDLQLVVGALTALLLPLAATASPDLRPMLWTWPLYALGALWVAESFERPRLLFAVQGLAVCWLLVLAVWLWRVHGVALGGVAFGAYALICALGALRVPPRFGRFALPSTLGVVASALLSLPALALCGVTASVAGLTLALVAASLALVAWRRAAELVVAGERPGGDAPGLALAYGAVSYGGAALLAAAWGSGLEAPLISTALALAALPCAWSAMGLQRSVPERTRALFASPLLHLTLTLLVGSGVYAWASGSWAPLLLSTAGLSYLLLANRRSAELVITGALFVGAAAAATVLLAPSYAPMAGLGACAALLALALLFPRNVARGSQRRRALMGAAHFFGLPLAAAASLVAIRGAESSLLAWTSGGLAVYAAMAAAQLRRPALAHLAALLLAVSVGVAVQASNLPPTIAVVLLTLLSLPALFVALGYGRRGRAEMLYGLVGSPGATLTLLLLVAAVVYSMNVAPLPVGFFVTLVTALLVVAHRAAWVAALATLLGASALSQGLAAHGVSPAISLAVVALLLLLATPRLPGNWANVLRRRRALLAVALLLQAASVLWALNAATFAPRSTPWWLFAAAASALFAVTASVLLHGQRWWTAVARVVGGLAASAAALLALHTLWPSADVIYYVLVLTLSALPWAALTRRSLFATGGITTALLIGAQLPLWAASLAIILDAPGFASKVALALLGGAVVAPVVALLVALSLLLSLRRVVVPGLQGIACLALASSSVLLGAGLGLPLATSPLCATALMLAVARPSSFLWALGTAGVALMASHGRVARPELCVALLTFAALGAIRWWQNTRDGRATSAPTYLASIAAVVGSQAALLTVATYLSTGRYPSASVLALLAPLTALWGFALLRWGRRHRALTRVGGAALPLAALFAASALVGCGMRGPFFVMALSLLTMVATTAFALRRAAVHDRRWLGDAALLGVVASYLAARLGVGPLASVGPWLDVALCAAAGPLALALRPRLSAGLRHAATRGAALLPLAALPLLVTRPAATGALLLLLMATHYGVAARQLGQKALGVVALLAANGALLAACLATGWRGPLLVIIPVGLSALTLLHLYEGEITPRLRRSARLLILVGLYGGSVAVACTAVSALSALVVVPLLCVAGMALGTVLRIRAYLLLSVVFLGVDLLVNMVRYGLAHRALGALFLTALGLAVVAAMAVFTLRRERILRRYSAFLGQLSAWD